MKRIVRKLGLAILLVPVVSAIGMWLPTETPLPMGIADALGCSGRGNIAEPPGWTWLMPSQLSNTEQSVVSIATDGFFVMDANVNGLSVEEARASLVVAVTGDNGVEVPGELALLKSIRPGWYLFGWTAKEPLTVGGKLSASLSASPVASSPIGGTFPLLVAGQPTALPTPSLSLANWTDFFHGVGQPLSCAGAAPCGQHTFTVTEAFVKQTAVEVLWNVPRITGGVAWEARLEASPAHLDAIVPEAAIDYLGENEQPRFDPGHRIVFPTASKTYCATLVLKDLRTGAETRGETCENPLTATHVASDTSIQDCSAPPNEALTEGWCRMHPVSTEAACAKYRADEMPSTGTGTATGTATGGTAATLPSPEPRSGAAPTTPAADAPERTSQGCALGGPRSHNGWALGLLGLLLARARGWRVRTARRTAQ